MKLSRTVVAAVSAIALFAGCTKKEDAAAAAAPKTENTAAPAAAPVAVVAGTPISAEVFDLWVKTRTQGRSTPDALTPEQRKEMLDDLVRLYVAAKTAADQGLDKGEVAARAELMSRSGLADLVAQQFLAGKEPTEEEIRKEYEEQVAKMPKTEYHARHILVATEDFAKDLIAQLGKGAKFEDLATKNSVDSSKDQGGDLGWFPAARMVKPFADAVEKLEKGKYTLVPVKSEFGYHIIKLEDTRPLEAPPFDAVKDQVGQIVMQKKLQAHLDGLAAQMKIERTAK